VYSTYVGAIETAEEFGRRIYTEAVRRGVTRAAKVIVLGDGAPWIWGIAEEHSPEAIQIVELYHAREHLANLAKIIYEVGSLRWKQWLAARIEEFDASEVEVVVLLFAATAAPRQDRKGSDRQGHRILPDQPPPDALCRSPQTRIIPWLGRHRGRL
jgi:hypothetical protein